MRILLLVLLLSTSAYATPIQYTIDFTQTQTGGITPTGSFLYDHESPKFTDFHILWAGLDLNFTGIANTMAYCTSCPSGIHGNMPCLAGQTGAGATFAFLNGACDGPGRNILWHGGFAATDVAYFEILNNAFDGSGGITLGLIAGVPIFKVPPASSGSWTITPVPEPSVLILLLTCLCSFALVARSSHHLRSAKRR